MSTHRSAAPAGTAPVCPATAESSGRSEPSGRRRPSVPGGSAVPSVGQGADPVRELMHRNRELCVRAVDPLEIAAALEAQGVTDRVAARYRHRDVFALAEELFARAPRAEGRSVDASAPAPGGPAATPSSVPGSVPGPVVGSVHGSVPGSVRGSGRASFRTLRALVAVLPGVLCAAAVAVLTSAESAASPVSPDRGDLTRTALEVAAGLACALVPAVWCARWFAVRAGRRLQHSGDLGEFASGVRPLLTAAVTLFTAASVGLRLAVREIVPLAAPHGTTPTVRLLPVATALGVLLFAALLLAAHGFGGTAAGGLLAACALQAATASAFRSAAGSAARTPTGSASGSASAAPSAEATADAVTSAVAVACWCTALLLLAYAYVLLARASAHRLPAAPGMPRTPRTPRTDPPRARGVTWRRTRTRTRRTTRSRTR
ncbi:hypothetical protein K378_00305 [Streptomyces sp. Amel2xB2]|uniref:hypothetical protein n=1 Tax=Streptomyces sp. Amel2xB2 TaxID=1305829 RepID=UPI000DBFAB9D|nr:hypothetical protein [Streptomyces sp. Amel2xB2]RAJ71485.1 hypothetical protein K378_00305 [Streptomyces sp. Amel2xB2]